jgi:hypothetical protein
MKNDTFKYRTVPKTEFPGAFYILSDSNPFCIYLFPKKLNWTLFWMQPSVW